ncbi:MAG TPA: hydantoinase/oxoprolinase family protein, partial [Solirubrobacteraceae bacterium]
MDIGGANTKAAWLDGEALRTVSRPFEVWRDREALAAVLRDVAAEVSAGPTDGVAITMTAELSDAFRTKREGVGFVLDAAQDAFGDRPLSVLTTAGELVSVAAARARPWDVAAEVSASAADAVAITMTAELSDAFRTKREGVTFVLDAAEDALGDRPLSVLTTAGELVSMRAARARPWDVAAANWVATALAV